MVEQEEDGYTFKYERNRRFREKNPSSIPVLRFNPDEKGSDWTSWMKTFQHAVFNSHKPKTKKRHYDLCCDWLVNYLSPKAVNVYEKMQE